MWKLIDLQKTNLPETCIDGQWVPSRPLNYTKQYLTLFQRLHRAWLVFTCKADAFYWPMKQ